MLLFLTSHVYISDTCRAWLIHHNQIIVLNKKCDRLVVCPQQVIESYSDEYIELRDLRLKKISMYSCSVLNQKALMIGLVILWGTMQFWLYLHRRHSTGRGYRSIYWCRRNIVIRSSSTHWQGNVLPGIRWYCGDISWVGMGSGRGNHISSSH